MKTPCARASYSRNIFGILGWLRAHCLSALHLWGWPNLLAHFSPSQLRAHWPRLEKYLLAIGLIQLIKDSQPKMFRGSDLMRKHNSLAATGCPGRPHGVLLSHPVPNLKHFSYWKAGRTFSLFSTLVSWPHCKAAVQLFSFPLAPVYFLKLFFWGIALSLAFDATHSFSTISSSSSSKQMRFWQFYCSHWIVNYRSETD